jgi:uncharacterized protein (TIGR02145 family)
MKKMIYLVIFITFIIGSCKKEIAPPSTDISVEINGIRWATRNVDAPGTFVTHPENAGMFYQWGSNVGWSNSDPLTATDGNNTWRILSETGSLWQRSKDPCPAGWRIPTRAELESLTNTTFVTREWTTVNGVVGYRFTDITSAASLFLPAVGSRSNFTGNLYQVFKAGFYWSSSPDITSSVYNLFFDSEYFGMNHGFRMSGFSIRCVAEQ